MHKISQETAERLLEALKLIAGATGNAYSKHDKMPVQTIARQAIHQANEEMRK